jgi:hypothetical protein
MMWGGVVARPRKQRIVLQNDPDEKPIPSTNKRRRVLPADESSELESRRRLILRYLEGGRMETARQISLSLGFEVGQVIGTMSRGGLLVRVSAYRAKWKLP